MARTLLFLIFCSTSLLGMESEDNDITTSSIINESIVSHMGKCHSLLKNNIISSQELVTRRNEFVAFVQKHAHHLNSDTCGLIIGFFHDRKKYYLGNDKEVPIFIDDETFERLRPFVINEQIVSQEKEKKEIFPYCVFSDPRMMNECIYKYKMLNPIEKGLRESWYKGVNKVLDIANKFKKVEKQIAGYDRTMLGAILWYVKNHGFFVEGTVYKGNKNLLFYDKKGESLPFARELEGGDILSYIEMIFQPRCYDKFNPKNFFGDNKKAVYTFLLSLKCYEKKLNLKVPKWLRLDILKHLDKYRIAQEMRPIIEEQMKQCRRLSDLQLDTCLPILMKWFDQEALK